MADSKTSGNLIFLDTEFTDFKKPKLISIGMVDTHGHEFYAELSGWKDGDCSTFVYDEVLPNLSGRQSGRAEVGAMLVAWLDKYYSDSAPIILVDSEFDLKLSSQLLADVMRIQRPSMVPDLRFHETGDDYDDFLVNWFNNRFPIPRHHALNDARAFHDWYMIHG